MMHVHKKEGISEHVCPVAKLEYWVFKLCPVSSFKVQYLLGLLSKKSSKVLVANKKLCVKIISYGTGKYCRISVVTCWNDHCDVLL